MTEAINVVRRHHAGVYATDKFLTIQTMSGFRGPGRTDYKGKHFVLAPETSDDEIGMAIRTALGASRWVLGAPRMDVVLPEGVEFDAELYDYAASTARYAEWVETMRRRFGYRSKKALLAGMRHCLISLDEDATVISPFRHMGLEGWRGMSADGSYDVVVAQSNDFVALGKGLRSALDLCM